MANMHQKTVVITGAAGSFGRTLVNTFLEASADVIAVDVNPEGLQGLMQGRHLKLVVADISSSAGADSVMEVVVDVGVDVLINNAGVSDGLALVDEITEEVWQRTLAVNLTGPFLLCKRVVPGMLRRGGGVIVNIASVAGLRGGRGGVAYTSSKWGLVGLTQNIAATFGGRGIRCNAICPGNTENGMSDKPGAPNEAALRILSRDRDKPAPGQWSQVASVALFLASDEASRMNGAVLPVDAGWIAY